MIVWFTLLACAPPVPDGLFERSPLAHVQRVGAFQVVPSVALPVSGPTGAVEVWLSLPDGSRVEGTTSAIHAYPAGTIADRVEFRDGRVVDVRGTRIDPDGRRWHHVYKPVSDSTKLLGASWPADDVQATEDAIGTLLTALQARGNRHTDAIRRKLDCESCHTADRPDNTTQHQHGLVNRGTDGAGFFTVHTLLRESVPLEVYGHTERGPFTTVRCDAQPLAGGERCPGSGVARATLDLERALAARDPHALAHRASREQLVARMEPTP